MGEKASITGCLNTAFYLILIFLLCYNFNMMIILFIYGITLLCINILPFIFDNLHSMLQASSLNITAF